MKQVICLFAVFIGSGLGGVCRWQLSSWLNGSHPWGTLTANIAGCLLLGFLSRHIPVNDQFRLLLTTGFCGGFTTFSTFVCENFFLMNGGQVLNALLYMALSLVLGLLATWCGYNVGEVLRF